MPRTLGIAVILSLLAAGCETPPQKPWHKEGATQEQFARDQMACRQYGMQSATANGLAGNLFVESWIQSEAAKCMQGLGYRQ